MAHTAGIRSGYHILHTLYTCYMQYTCMCTCACTWSLYTCTCTWCRCTCTCTYTCTCSTTRAWCTQKLSIESLSCSIGLDDKTSQSHGLLNSILEKNNQSADAMYTLTVEVCILHNFVSARSILKAYSVWSSYLSLKNSVYSRTESLELLVPC